MNKKPEGLTLTERFGLLVSDVIRTNELQVWFVSSHLVHGPLVAHEG